MREILEKDLSQGVTDVVFGDMFLESIRAYREERLAEVDMKGIFPLWGMDTRQLVRDFLDLGFKAILVFVDTGTNHHSIPVLSSSPIPNPTFRSDGRRLRGYPADTLLLPHPG